METLLFLGPVLGCLFIALSRVVALRPVEVPGEPLARVSLSFAERVRYHRMSIYGIAALLLLGAVTDYVSWPVELMMAGAMLGIIQIGIEYQLTDRGVALNRVVFRSWSEFRGFQKPGTSLIVSGRDGMGDFRIRRATNAAVQVVRKRLPAISQKAPLATSRGFRGIRYAMLIVPAVAVIVALGSSVALADDPDAAGTTVGTAEDLAGIGVGGGQTLAGVDADGAVDGDATAARFEDAKANEPFAYDLAGYVNQNRLAINFVWVLVTGYLVMFMQAGFAMVETGFCRAKSAMHVMMTNFMIYGIGMLAYWAVGFAIAFGGVGLTGPTNLGAGLLLLDKEATITISDVDYGLFGYKGFFLAPDTLDVGIAVLFLFQMVFMDTAATILTGAVAERWTWLSFLIWGVFVGAIIQPVIANWAWGGGWLFDLAASGIERPYVDFAGSGVVHMVGGFAALGAAMVLGPRLGKYNNDGSVNAIPGHNLNMAAIGTFILAFGWFGFNPGSTLGAAGSGNLRIGMIAVSTMLAGAGGSVAAMAYAKATLGKYDPGYMINGLLAGLVAITAPSGYVSPSLAVLIGVLAGGLVCVSMVFLERTLKVDDPVGAISVHGVCGLWGVISVGLFADGTAPDYLVVGYPIEGLFFGDGRQIISQIIGGVTIAAWSFGTSWVLFKAIMMLGIFRSKPEDELRGLDLPEMGTHAYPVEDMPSERGIEPGTFIPGAAPSGAS